MSKIASLITFRQDLTVTYGTGGTKDYVKHNGTRSLAVTGCHQIRGTCTGTPVQRRIDIAQLFITKK